MPSTAIQSMTNKRLSVKVQVVATIAAIVGAVAVPQIFHLLGAVSGLGTPSVKHFADAPSDYSCRPFGRPLRRSSCRTFRTACQLYDFGNAGNRDAAVYDD